MKTTPETKMTAVKMFINDHLSREFQATYTENVDDSIIEIKIDKLQSSLLTLAIKYTKTKFSFAPDTEKEKLSISIEDVTVNEDGSTVIKIKFYFE